MKVLFSNEHLQIFKARGFDNNNIGVFYNIEKTIMNPWRKIYCNWEKLNGMTLAQSNLLYLGIFPWWLSTFLDKIYPVFRLNFFPFFSHNKSNGISSFLLYSRCLISSWRLRWKFHPNLKITSRNFVSSFSKCQFALAKYSLFFRSAGKVPSSLPFSYVHQHWYIGWVITGGLKLYPQLDGPRTGYRCPANI